MFYILIDGPETYYVRLTQGWSDPHITYLGNTYSPWYKTREGYIVCRRLK